jgi:hypothetical protein
MTIGTFSAVSGRMTSAAIRSSLPSASLSIVDSTYTVSVIAAGAAFETGVMIVPVASSIAATTLTLRMSSSV